MKKLSTSFFMRAAIAIALLFATAGTAAAYDFMYNGLAYNYDGDGTSVYVTYTSDNSDNYGGSLTNVVIPAKITLEGGVSYNVTGIGQYAFSNCTNLQSITIPSSVKTIGEAAFVGSKNIKKLVVNSLDAWFATTLNGWITSPHDLYVNSQLVTSVTIPSSITKLDKHLFYVTSLKSVTIPNTLTEIGNSAFAACSKLSTVNLGSGLKTIDNYAFEGCVALTSITFPTSLKTISVGAFSDCSGLTSLTIPESLEVLESAFSGCFNIKTLVWNAKNFTTNGGIPTENITKVTLGNNVQTIPDNFLLHSQISTISFPSTVKTIGTLAFNNCANLTSVSIPNGCYVKSYAFSSCPSLQSVTIPATISCGTDIFNNTTGIKKLTWNANGVSSQFVPTVNIEQVTIGSGVTELPQYFLQDAKITCLSLPSSLTTIGNYAFQGCSGLSSLSLPSNLATIGSYAFQNCNGITSLTIPENLTSIGSNAFSGCNNITQLTWNAINLTTNGGITTSNITKVTIGNKVQNIPEYFVSSSKITSVSIPSSITTIGKSAFVGCKGLTSLNIPDNVTTIGESAFNGCSNLTKLILGKGLTTIRNYAFEGTNIVVLRIPESVTSVGWCAFYNQNEKIVKIYNASNLGLSSSWFRDDYHLPRVTIGKGSGYNVNLDPNTSFEVDGITYVITDMTNRKVKIVDVNETKCASDIEVKKVKYRNVEFTPTELGTAALAGNFTVKSFKFGDVTTIPSYTFYESALTKAEIPNSITSVDQHAFENCKRMTEFVVGTGVNTIDQFVLTGCSALRRVELGSNVASISAYSFKGCSKIKTLRVRRNTPPNAVSGVFNDLDKWSCTLYVPKGTVDTYKNANEWKTFFFISDDETEPSDGDVNGDGKINVSDVTALINMIMGITTMDEASADVNGDGKVNVSDVSALINIILGIS